MTDSLKKIEELIQTKFVSYAPALTEISNYLFTLGGKRIRPQLIVETSMACGMEQPPASVLQVGAGIEIIHMATLLHDDIIDKSSLRRHEMSPFIKYGIDPTLLTGDFLLVRAFSLCAHLDNYVVERTEEACVELTEGEILEIPLSKQVATLKDSKTIAIKKTASLFRLATELGAYLSGKNPEIVNHFKNFGEHLGTAYQIVDDILDVTADLEVLGKPPGIDIREQKPSFVNVLWLESGSALAKECLLGEVPGDKQIKAGVKEICEGQTIAQAKVHLQNELDLAKQELSLALEGKEHSGLNAILKKCETRGY